MVVTDLSAVTSCPFTLHPTKEAIVRVVQHTEQSPIQLADVLTRAHRATLAGCGRNRIRARRIAVQSRLRDHSGFASEDSTWIVLLGPLRLGFMMDPVPHTTFGRSNQLNNFQKAKKPRRTRRLIPRWQNQGSRRAHLTETREEQERKKKKRKRTIRNPLASIEQRVGPWSNATRRLPV